MLGEDVPMLIPISIILVVFVIFLVSLFSGFIDQNEIIRMSQSSVNLGGSVINVFSDESGQISLDKLQEQTDGKCIKLSRLGIDTKFKARVEIESGALGKSWCWSTTSTIPEKKSG